jgi:SAM-dependent methyltransferase
MNLSPRKNLLLNKILKPSFWEKLSPAKRRDFIYQKEDFWNLVAEDYDDLEETSFYKEMQRDILLEMEDIGALKPDFTFFDVACGTGNYTVKVADKVSQVFALDISQAMLNILKKKIEEKGLKNIIVIQADWKKYEPDRTFDTVFVSMTPILRDINEVKRLYNCAQKFFIIVSWAGLRKNHLLDEIEKRFFKKLREEIHPGLFLLFNYFYTLGNPGNVKFYEGFFERRTPVEKIWKRFKFKLTAKGYKIGIRKEREILKFLSAKAKDGIVENKTKVRIGALFIKKGGIEDGKD